MLANACQNNAKIIETFFYLNLIDFDNGEFSLFVLTAGLHGCFVWRWPLPCLPSSLSNDMFPTSFSHIKFLFDNSFFKQPPQPQLDHDADRWVMPHKKEHHAYLCRFMEFQHGFSVEFDSRGQFAAFTRRELLDVWPIDIQRFMGLISFGDPDCSVHAPANHRPINCRSSALEAAKRALSHYMPHRAAPWCNNQGNPARSAPVNDVVKEAKKFEVRGEGSPSKAKRAVRPNEFARAVRILWSLPSFDCQHKHPMACLWQHALIGRLDDAAHFEVKDPAGHPNFDFALRTNVRWSKNVMEERQCPPQASSCMCPLCLLLVVLTSI